MEHLRECVSITSKDQRPVVTVSSEVIKVPDDGMLVRNLFSLTGSRRESSLLCELPQLLPFPYHPGYASVGMIEEVGYRCSFFTPGQLVLLPAQYSNYTVFTGVTLKEAEKLLRPVAHLDPSDVPFLPLLSLAYLLSCQLEEIQAENILLIGCNLLGALLIQLITAKNERCRFALYLDADDFPENWFSHYAVQEILRPGQTFPSHWRGYADVVLLLSDIDKGEDLTDFLATRKSISALPDPLKKRLPLSWLQLDAFGEAQDLLRQQVFNLDDLVEMHAHAEACPALYSAICAHQYQGKAIIYDW